MAATEFSCTYEVDQYLGYSSNVSHDPIDFVLGICFIHCEAEFEILFAELVLKHLQSIRQLTVRLRGLGLQ